MKDALPGLRNLTRNDIEKAERTLTSAFSEDPCLKYLLASDSYDPEKARHVHRYSLNLGLIFGSAYCAGEGAEGVCIWLPPSRAMTSTWMFLRAGGLGLRKTVDEGIIGRLKDYGDYSGAIHHRSAPGPHWYLLSIGVDRAAQGKGMARRLMEPMLERFDRGGEAAYLETHNGRNVAFYEKFGFEVAEVGCLPGTKTTHWGMLRKPRK
jgi:ribosomal protein S18 acetylase RimI-like enzyme